MKNLVNAKNYYNSCLSLPIFYDLSVNQQKYVIDFLKTYVDKNSFRYSSISPKLWNNQIYKKYLSKNLKKLVTFV